MTANETRSPPGRLAVLGSALEGAAWSVAIGENHSVTPLLGAVLIADLAVMEPQRAASCAALQAAMSLGARRITGLRRELYPHLLSVTALASGLGLRRIELNQARADSAEIDAAESAVLISSRESAMFDAITAPVTFGGQTLEVLDRVSRFYPIFRDHPSLSEETCDLLFRGTKERAAHSGNMSLTFAIRHSIDAYNDITIDINRKVSCTPVFEDALGSWWVTPSQGRQIQRAVEEMAPVRVFVVVGESYNGVGRQMRIAINGRSVAIAGEPDYLPGRLTNPAPIAPLLGVLWALMEATPIATAVPWSTAAAPAVLFAVVAARADRLHRREGSSVEKRILTEVTLAAAAQFLIIGAATYQAPHTPTGRRRTRLQTASLAPSFLAGLLSDSRNVGRVPRTAVVAIGLLAVAPGGAAELIDRAIPWSANLSLYVGGRSYARSTSELSRRRTDQQRRRLADLSADEHARVTMHEWQRLAAAVGNLDAILRDAGSTLEPLPIELSYADVSAIRMELDAVLEIARQYT